MRLVIQRALRGAVHVDGSEVGSIGPGLVVLVGIGAGDTRRELEQLARKLLSLRLWDSEDGKPWQRNVSQMNYGVLLVSQFTLYGNVKNGTKPDFHAAMRSELSRPLFDDFVKLVQERYPAGHVATGSFGNHMDVELVNDGPVTIIVDADPVQPQNPKPVASSS